MSKSIQKLKKHVCYIVTNKLARFYGPLSIYVQVYKLIVKTSYASIIMFFIHSVYRNLDM